MYIPWNWIKKNLKIYDFDCEFYIEKINYFGLECEVVKDGNSCGIIFFPSSNRNDLKSWFGIIKEISILLDIELLNFSYKNLKKNEEILEYNFVEIEINSLLKHKFPEWILESLSKNRIECSDLISNIINFVKLETGISLKTLNVENKEN